MESQARVQTEDKGVVMECEFPTVNSSIEEIREIFSRVKTIAVLGLSPDETKASHRVAKYLQEVGYKIVPIYPKEQTILGERVYRSLKDVPFKIDMVDIFRKSAALDDIADAVMKRGDVNYFWTQQGIVNNSAAQKVASSGVVVVQSRCAMVEHKRISEA